MKKKGRQGFLNNRAAAIVEAAISLPIVFILLAGCIDILMAISVASSVDRATDAVKEGVIAEMTKTGILVEANKVMPGFAGNCIKNIEIVLFDNINALDFSDDLTGYDYSLVASRPPVFAKVGIKCEWDFLMPFMKEYMSDGYAFSATRVVSMDQ